MRALRGIVIKGRGLRAGKQDHLLKQHQIRTDRIKRVNFYFMPTLKSCVVFKVSLIFKRLEMRIQLFIS